jgi:lipocalin
MIRIGAADCLTHNILTRSSGPRSCPSDVCARYAWAFMKHVAGVPHSKGTRITVVAFSRVHAARSATVVEQTRISAVSIVGSPANEYGRLIVRTIRLEEVICVTFRAGPRRRGGLDVVICASERRCKVVEWQ